MTMAQSQDPIRMTEAEYLDFEASSDVKHEFVAGRVYAMAGAGVNHNIINSNANAILNNQLFGKPCVTMSSDMRVKVKSESVSYRYPDIVVVCGAVELADNSPQSIVNPVVIVEVLSPSTALRDYNEKLSEYTQLETLQSYVLISQHDAKVEVYSRNDANQWVYTPVIGLDATVSLDAIACQLDLARLYDKTDIGRSD